MNHVDFFLSLCCCFPNTLLIFFYIVALGPERRKSDSGVMLPTLRVSLIQDMRYLLYVLAYGDNFWNIHGFHINCSNNCDYGIFCLCILKKTFFIISFILFLYCYDFPDIKSKGKMQLRSFLNIPKLFYNFFCSVFFF